MSDDSKSKMYTHIVKQLDGYKVAGARKEFNIKDLKEGRIFFKKPSETSGDGAYISNRPNNSITATEANLIPLNIMSKGDFYEATVENIQASVIIHEWYGHLRRGWGDASKTHRFCYSAVMNDPLYKRTTERYQSFVSRMYKVYHKKECK